MFNLFNFFVSKSPGVHVRKCSFFLPDPFEVTPSSLECSQMPENQFCHSSRLLGIDELPFTYALMLLFTTIGHHSSHMENLPLLWSPERIELSTPKIQTMMGDGVEEQEERYLG